MKSSYKRLGNYIQEVKTRNADLEAASLLGINIDKFFMPSVANVIGTEMSVYKIVNKGQFACNRMHVGRDYRIPIALSNKDEPFMVSPAYDVFEIIDTKELLPEYLMMWFSRQEFDRNAWFYTDADVRGGLPWKSFCDIQLPIPLPNKQREIIKEYHTVVNRITLNNQLIQKLEETAQTLYKHWFVDFEFPDENGKPYKSSGGEMEFNDELEQELPKGWMNGGIEKLAKIIDGDRGNNYPSQENFREEGFCLFLNAGNVSKIGFDFSTVSFISKERDELLRKGKLDRNDIVLTTRGTVGNVAFFSNQVEYENIRINSGMVILRASHRNAIYLYSLLRSENMKIIIANYLSGSAQPQLPIRDIQKMPLVIPNENTINKFYQLANSLQVQIDFTNKQNRYLTDLKNILLSRIAIIED